MDARMPLIAGDFGFVSRRRNAFEPFSLDLCDSLDGLNVAPSSYSVLSLPHHPSSFTSGALAFIGARVDWKETPEAHVFMTDLPGMKKEEVKVEVEGDGVLQISGERQGEKEEKTTTWHLLERGSGKFQRRFRLAENARVDQVRAAMEDGVLTVIVPKEVKKPGVKSVEISG